MTAPRRHALVLGAGVAGLLAARVLAERFDRVTLVERDELDAKETVRRGVPQAWHLHGLLDRGRRIMEELYPGFTEEAVSDGATVAEVLVGTRWYVGGSRLAAGATGLTSLIATRSLLETVLRRRTLRTRGIELLTRTTAQGLVGDAERVRAVRVTGPAGEQTLAADLIVDASGRGSRITQWLDEIGAEVPEEERLDVDLGYASRFFRHRPGQLGGQASVIVSTGADGRGGGAVRVEGDRWHVTLAGMLGDHPPTDDQGFRDYAASLSAPDIHTIVVGSDALGEPVPYRFRTAVRRRFDRQSAPPAGLVVLGDAQCAFNPLYAQGMTVAALQAAALRDSLDADDLPARFYATAADAVAVAWQLAAGSDLRHPGVEGRRTLRTRLTDVFVTRVQRVAHHDPRVARTFLRVAHLVDPPTALTAPGTLRRILLS
ncbi:FAD-binding monooxygenase [Nocardia neocaledoniensis NBRC 108232]|uniref:2-polyprenyl-6-methoxyphenol hydroxylase-like FAD-dependent oxidoreductase n=1 Tax=Nocardia neocaledoniensis TaxID=236511 RepID=A0A317NZN8_9NOCA|nr:FAD-dependent monooxygenase [Nocardia neocaledoniensis]PWV80710.1 2-polyprenyl-6-methoxyphenol hydroxylase-like FAD-dependent oxidoreductase [Nocardia neocaledoniensis]GEM32188.1 FAD-binding monooxygenase [Nocardia neocaledoniensis NBRC 108232]